MRWVWSGVLMAGLLLVLWGVFESQQATPDPTRYYWEDGTPPPTQPPKPPSRQ